MTLRYSATKYLSVLEPVASTGIGWEARVVDPADFASVLARIPRFQQLTVSKASNDIGVGSIALDTDDRVFTDPLPNQTAGTIISRECLWQFWHNGVLRFEWFGEDVSKDVVTDTETRATVVAGRSTEKVLEWGVAVPGEITAWVEDPKAEQPDWWDEGTMGPWEPPLIQKQITDPMEFSDVPGAVALKWLIEENVQPRGTIPFVTCMFTATHDSEGQEWADSSSIVIEPGESPLALLMRLADQLGWEFKMLPGFRLFIAQDGYGVDRRSEIKCFVSRHQIDHKETITSRDVATVVYAQAQNGKVAFASGASDAGPHRREAWVEAGDAKFLAGAGRVARASLKTLQNRQVGRSVKVDSQTPGRAIFVDYDVNDWITIEDAEYQDQVVKMHAATLTVRDTGQTDLELTVQTRQEARAVKVARLLNKMGAQKVSTPSSTPIKYRNASQDTATTPTGVDGSPVLTDGKVDWDLLRWNEPKQRWQIATPDRVIRLHPQALSWLTDIDLSTPPVDGQAIVYDEAAGLWKPGDVAAGGGGGGTGGGDVVKAWKTVLDNAPMTSLTGWAVKDGNWATGAYGVQQSDTSRTNAFLMFDTVLPLSGVAMKAVLRFPTATSTHRAGFQLFGPNGGISNPAVSVWLRGDGVAEWDRYGSGGGTLASGVAVAANTDVEFAVVRNGPLIDVYVNGQAIGTVVHDVGAAWSRGRVGLETRTGNAWFRNVSIWTPLAPWE